MHLQSSLLARQEKKGGLSASAARRKELYAEFDALGEEEQQRPSA